MKLLQIVALWVLAPGWVAGQHCEYAAYYEKIEPAREAFREKRHKDACALYAAAFQTTALPLGSDLYSAILSGEEVNGEEFLEQCCVLAAKSGIPFSFFRKFSKKKWFADFNAAFPEYAAHYQKNFNPELRKKMVALQKLDKQVNERFHEWRTRKADHPLDSLIVQMKQVSKEFQQLISAYGFPSEAKTGYYFAKGKIDMQPTLVLLIHIYQRGELLFKENLDELACRGTITPADAQTLEATRGHGNSTGIEQEMAARAMKYGRTDD